jgi:protein-S-isoprenylcysteine O-methyltransferase Ste14
MSLKSRLAVRVVLVVPFFFAVLFLPAGSLDFWQGWVFVGMFLVFNAFFCGYFLRRDPKLIERRLQMKERRSGHKWWTIVWTPLWIATLILPGLDYRFGWSRSLLAPVPLWLSLISQMMIAVSWLLIFQVFRYNTFASAVVQVESGQQVISGGPYRFVRHPMYSAIVLMVAVAPLALGSYIALPVAWLKVPLILARLRNEERMLLKELPGYPEYRLRTRYRLIPAIW